MRVSIALSQRLGAETTPYAQRAEALGFDGVFAFDHLVPLGDPLAPALEAAASLGSLAATLGIRVGSLVLRTTLRPPEVTAAIARTLAAVANVPPVIGLGAGDSLTKEETRRFGLPFPPLAERVEALAATVEAVRASGVETWVGGGHPQVIDVASRADGWNLWEQPTERRSAMTDPPTEKPFSLTWGGRVLVGDTNDDIWLSGDPDRIAERLNALEEAGFDEVILAPLPSTDPDVLDAIARIRG